MTTSMRLLRAYLLVTSMLTAVLYLTFGQDGRPGLWLEALLLWMAIFLPPLAVVDVLWGTARRVRRCLRLVAR